MLVFLSQDAHTFQNKNHFIFMAVSIDAMSVEKVNRERQETELENLLIVEDCVLMRLVPVGSCEPDTSCTHARIICTGVSGAHAHLHFRMRTCMSVCT